MTALYQTFNRSEATKLEFGKFAYLWLDNSCGSTYVVSGVSSLLLCSPKDALPKKQRGPAFALAEELFSFTKHFHGSLRAPLLNPHFTVNTFQSISPLKAVRGSQWDTFNLSSDLEGLFQLPPGIRNSRGASFHLTLRGVFEHLQHLHMLHSGCIHCSGKGRSYCKNINRNNLDWLETCQAKWHHPKLPSRCEGILSGLISRTCLFTQTAAQ